MVETCLKRVETDFRTDFEMGTIELNYDYHELSLGLLLGGGSKPLIRWPMAYRILWGILSAKFQQDRCPNSLRRMGYPGRFSKSARRSAARNIQCVHRGGCSAW